VPVDKVNCARCGMMISSETQSAEWVAAGEETRFYDDIGCLATDAWSAGEGGARFVHADGARWAPAESVFYARPANVSTPMGYGVVAFSSREEAAARDRQGRARAWSDLAAELRSEPAATGGRP
jgi:copper chaperone NosL